MIRSIVTNKEKLALASERVHNIESVEDVIEDMIDTANHYRSKPIGCIGLAANQIGHRVRVIIVWRENEWLVMINPEVELVKGKSGYMTEGCLSRPGVKSKLKRNKKVRVSFLDKEEGFFEIRYSGMTARVIQHEVDHLNGVYI